MPRCRVLSAVAWIGILVLSLGRCGPPESPIIDQPVVVDDPRPTPVYLAMTYHIENWSSGAAYALRLIELRKHIAKFNHQDALATLETGCNRSTDCDRASCTRFNAEESLLAYFLEGHAIGLHADMCGKYSCTGGGKGGTGKGVADCVNATSMGAALDTMRVTLATNSGVKLEFIRHVSGVCSDINWADAVAQSELEFANGVVDYCTTSLPEGHSEKQDCPKGPGRCHEPWPPAMPDLLHPWLTKASPFLLDWTLRDTYRIASPTELGIVPGLGPFKCLDGDDPCNYSSNDAAFFFDALDDAVTHHSEAEPHHLDFLHVKMDLNGPDPTALKAILKKIKEDYVDRGTVKWMTLPQMYDKYVSSLDAPPEP